MGHPAPSGQDRALQRRYAAPSDASDPAASGILRDAMARHPDLVQHWLDCAPETNEVRRSSVLINATMVLTRAPLAHLALEADTSDDGAPLTLQTWPGGTVTHLGRADFHGRWVRWQAS